MTMKPSPRLLWSALALATLTALGALGWLFSFKAMVLAQGRGRGAGFSFQTGLAAVAWDRGAWCLIYRLDELSGAELLIDDLVVARATVTALDEAKGRVTLETVCEVGGKTVMDGEAVVIAPRRAA